MSVKRDRTTDEEASIDIDARDSDHPSRKPSSPVGGKAADSGSEPKSIGSSFLAGDESSMGFELTDTAFVSARSTAPIPLGLGSQATSTKDSGATAPGSSPLEEPSFTIDAREASFSPRDDESIREPLTPPSGVMPGRGDSSITFEKVSGIWSKFVQPDTPSTNTIQRRPPREVMRTLRTASKVVAPPRSVTAKAPGLPPDYEIIEKLGEGGMGLVYLARQTSIDRTIAIKMLKPEGAHDDEVRARFLSEAAVTGALDHPNIVPIHDLGSNEQGALFYSMKRVRGTPWCDVLVQRPMHENLDIWMKMADALAFAHSRGIIHRDIKPENVMLGEYGEVLVMDWGLAMSVVESGRAAYYDAGDSMAGTPAYMAPEMASGSVDQLSFTSDVYLLGAVLFEIVAGFPPHTGKNVMGCLYAAASNQIRRTEKKGELIDIALKAMETNPLERFQTVTDLQNAVKAFRSHEESFLLSSKAQDALERAASTDDYNDFAEALFGFREALTLWSGNLDAEGGVVKAAVAYARSAFDKGDLDLATSLLDAKIVDHQPLLVLIEEEIRTKEANRKSYERIQTGVKALIAAVFLIVVVALFWINAERQRADIARENADSEAKRARASQSIAEDATAKAKTAQDAAEVARDETSNALQAAQAAKAETELALNTAKRDRDAAEAAKQEAFNANDRAERGAYLAEMGLIAAQIRDNAFGIAALKLVGSQAKRRSWEFGWLRHLCNLSERTYLGHTRPISGVAMMRDGRLLTCSEDRTVRLWQADGEEALYVWKLPSPANAIDVSPDGRWFVVGMQNCQSSVYDLQKLEPQPRFFAKEGVVDSGGKKLTVGPVLSVAFGLRPAMVIDRKPEPAALHIFVSYDQKNCVYAYRLPVPVQSGPTTLTALQAGPQPADAKGPLQIANDYSYQQHQDAARCVRYHEPTRRLLTAAKDGGIYQWDPWTVGAPDPSKRIDFKGIDFLAAAFSPDGKRIAAAAADGMVYTWEENGSRSPGANIEKSVAFRAHTMGVRALAFSADGQDLVTGSEDNTLRVWGVASLSPEAAPPTAGTTAASAAPKAASIAVTAAAAGVTTANAGTATASAGTTATVKILGDEEHPAEVAFLEPSKAFRGHKHEFRGHAGWVRSVAYDPRPGKPLIYSSSQDGRAKAWNIETYHETLMLSGHAANTGLDTLSGAFSPNGELVATGGDTTVRLWETTSGEQRALLEEGHPLGTSGAAVSRDGKRLVTTSPDNSAAVWDLEKQVEILRFRGHPDEVTCADFSPAGDWIVDGCDDGSIAMWSLETGKLIRSIPIFEAAVSAVVVSPDGSRIAAGLANGKIRLLDSATGADVQLLRGHSGKINSLAFSRDGKLLYTASEDNTSGCWLVDDGREVTPTLPHPQPVYTVALSPDGNYLATGDFSGSIRVWDARTRELLFLMAGAKKSDDKKDDDKQGDAKTSDPRATAEKKPGDKKSEESKPDDKKPEDVRLQRHGAMARSLAFSPDGAKLVSGDNNGNVILWNVSRFTKQGVRPVRENGKFVGFSDKGSAEGATLIEQAWNAATGSIVRLAYLPNSEKLVVAAKFDVTIVDLSQKPEGRVPLAGLSSHLSVAAVAFHPSGKYVVSAGRESVVKIWDVAAQRAVRKLFGVHLDALTSVAVSDDGKYIVSGDLDGIAVVWDFETGAKLKVLGPIGGEWQGDARDEYVPYAVRSVAFSKDGALVAMGTDDEKVRLWKWQTSEPPRELLGHTKRVSDVAFSHDGQRLVSSGQDESGDVAIVWNLADGRPLGRLRGHSAFITSVDFLHDDKRIVTASDDGTARIWNAEFFQEVLVLKGDSHHATTGMQGATAKLRMACFGPQDDGAAVLTTTETGDAFLWPTLPWKEKVMRDLPAPVDEPKPETDAVAAEPSPAPAPAAPAPSAGSPPADSAPAGSAPAAPPTPARSVPMADPAPAPAAAPAPAPANGA